MYVKVTSSGLLSATPAIAYYLGKMIAGHIQYEPGKWMQALPGSKGIFIYEILCPEDMRNIIVPPGGRIWECEARQVRPVKIILGGVYLRIPEIVYKALMNDEVVGYRELAIYADPRLERIVRVASEIRLVKELHYEVHSD